MKCLLCFESYTDPGTEHVPYSAPCEHIMGKSCLERLKEYGSRSEFNCPFCKKRIIFESCHLKCLSLNEYISFTPNGKNQTKSNTTKNRRKGDFTDEMSILLKNVLFESMDIKEDVDKYLNSEAVVGDFLLRDLETNV
uniref:RING-type domain-containing protein n=1 Tax=Strongyloides papillosus TaxID=174720 RepID=A0A0N5C2F4_STREA